MGRLASQYSGDLAQRANEVAENTSLQENYQQAQNIFQQGLAQWNYVAEGDAGQGIDELKQWGIEAGSELVVSKLSGMYAGSALQKSVGGLYDAGVGYVKSAYKSALDAGQEVVDKGTSFVSNAITDGKNTAQTLLERGTSTVKSALDDGTALISSGQQTLQDFVNTGQKTLQDTVSGAQQTVQDAVSGGADLTNPVSAEDTEADFTNPTFYGGGQSVGDTQQMFNNPLFEEATASPDMTLGAESTTTAYRSSAPYLEEETNATPEVAPEPEVAPTESTSNLTTVESSNQTVENENTNAETTFNTESNTYNAELTDYNDKDYTDMENVEGGENPDTITTEADSAGGDILENLGEDALVDTATSGLGVGEVLMAGQLLYSGVKGLWDAFDPPKPPPPPTPPSAPVYQQVQALPSYIQASAQSGV